MELLEILQNRHSVRSYTDEKIPKEKLEKIIDAGLLSASGHGYRPWELIVVREKETLQQLSQARVGSAKMLEKADAAIIVIGDHEKSDTWVEDCSIVMSNMHLMADSLGVGSCWIQGRNRETPSGQTTEAYVRSILGFPENYSLLAMLSLGMPAKHAPKTELSKLPREKVHQGKF